MQRMEDRLRNLDSTIESSTYNSQQLATSADGGAIDAPTAPLQIIHDAGIQTGHESYPIEVQSNMDIIQKGILPAGELKGLLTIFQKHYGRWISIPEDIVTGPRLMETHNPLLLCACCLVAARHAFLTDEINLTPVLFKEVKSLLGCYLLQPRQSVEFFQASLILSLWSTTAGQHPLSLDAWLITGVALQQGLISDTLGRMAVGDLNQIDKDFPIDAFYLWNHLCLSHLHSCISMRRKAMITAAQVKQSRLVLRIPTSTNFEIRMAAELHLYWTLYEECMMTDPNFIHAKASLNAWKTEWSFLFQQPRHHFLLMGYHFAQLLVSERALNTSTAAADQTLLLDMARLCSDILHEAMQNADERTEYLTDHIYHMISFAAITLSRLLAKYESPLSAACDITSKHALVRQTSQWLRSIGLPRHIGKAMGSIISKLYNTLFPAQQPLENDEMQLPPDLNDLLGVPEFFGLDASFDWSLIQ